MFLKKRVLAAAVAISLSAGGALAAVIDLGFSLDSSGSVSSSEFTTAKNGLAAALDNIPTAGPNQYRVAVTQFGSSVSTIVGPTIVTAGNIAGIKAAVQGAPKGGGSTNTSGAITHLTDLFVNDGGLNATALFNITTDGQPNNQGASEAAALAAYNAGVSGISLEAVGSISNSTLERMRRIAALGTNGDTAPASAIVINDPNNIPNPINTGFVLTVADFNGYSAAINAKVRRVVTPTNPIPIPASLPLLIGGLAMMGFVGRRRRKS